MVEREARMEPPIQTEYFLSGGAMILILMVEGARAVISFCLRSAIPGYMVVPPDMTVLAYRRRSPPWLPPPSRSRSSLPPRVGGRTEGDHRPGSLHHQDQDHRS